ncbi:SAM-dependent methyltransferases [Nonlabens ulvanivorans]|uniref:SAM-dependent methyltransferases n=1 Tax=Nonlabens ulvanivorans TaxID=906888 RepID=A0A081DA83_NONUL|nr:SAM-dependent methyltransferases [Nonlabens ulvanivorans]
MREYLLEHLHVNAASFLLKSHPFDSISPQELTQQLVGLQKARLKFEPLFVHDQVIFPPKVNLEQTSSWSTATYKANLFSW